VTQKQLLELLESEGARSVLEQREERGWIDRPSSTHSLLSTSLSTPRSRNLTRDLGRVGLEVRDAPPEKLPDQDEAVVYETDKAVGCGRQLAAFRTDVVVKAAHSSAGGHPRELRSSIGGGATSSPPTPPGGPPVVAARGRQSRTHDPRPGARF